MERTVLPATLEIGPGRVVRVSLADPSAARGVSSWCADDVAITEDRHAALVSIITLIAAGDEDLADHALLQVRDDEDRLVALAGYHRDDAETASMVGEIDRRLHHLGLGTFLLRRLAETALAHGVHRFRIDVPSDHAALPSLLRDCGLRISWDFDIPSIHVELDLGNRRPGWATPDCESA